MNTVHAPSSPVVIAGGGIAGLSAALALGLKGFPVQLLEQADQIGAIGYGVQMGPNVMPMLETLGIAHEVVQASYLPQHVDLLEAYSGVTLTHLPVMSDAYRARYQGRPYLAIHRVDLHEILLKACAQLPHVHLNQSTAVVDYEQDSAQVRVKGSDGQVYPACALLAADGLRSKLRAKMHPNDSPRESGYVAHRALIPWSELPEALVREKGVSMWTGEGFHVIYYPLRQASVLNVVLVVELPKGVQGVSDQAYLEHIERIQSKVCEPARLAMGMMDLSRRWAIADREPIRPWSDQRVTLIGDSAHATLQSFAQGACMALEDAVMMAELLARSNSNVQEAFKLFERKRFLRTARVQLQSRNLWTDFHCAGVEAEVRTARFTGQQSEDFFRCLDWLWTPIDISA